MHNGELAKAERLQEKAYHLESSITDARARTFSTSRVGIERARWAHLRVRDGVLFLGMISTHGHSPVLG